MIIDIVATVEFFRAFPDRFKKVAQRGDRAVVKIGRAEPNTIERHICIAECFLKVLEAPWITGIQSALVYRERVRVRVQPVTISPDIFDRDHFAYPASFKISPILSVTVCAVFPIKLFPSGSARLIDGERKAGWFLGEKPLFDPCDPAQINGGGRGSGSKSGALVPFFHGIVVPVPVKLHAFPWSLEPDGREVNKTDPFSLRKFLHGEIQENLGWIEGIGPARAELRLPVHEAEPMTQHEQLFPHAVNSVILQGDAIYEIEITADVVDLQ